MRQPYWYIPYSRTYDNIKERGKHYEAIFTQEGLDLQSFNKFMMTTYQLLSIIKNRINYLDNKYKGDVLESHDKVRLHSKLVMQQRLYVDYVEEDIRSLIKAFLDKNVNDVIKFKKLIVLGVEFQNENDFNSLSIIYGKYRCLEGLSKF